MCIHVSLDLFTGTSKKMIGDSFPARAYLWNLMVYRGFFKWKDNSGSCNYNSHTLHLTCVYLLVYNNWVYGIQSINYKSTDETNIVLLHVCRTNVMIEMHLRCGLANLNMVWFLADAFTGSYASQVIAAAFDECFIL